MSELTTPDQSGDIEGQDHEHLISQEDWDQISRRLAEVFNVYNVDVFARTPDHFLADYAVDAVQAYARTIQKRDRFQL